MQRWRGYDAAPVGWGRSVVTIGVFDGVHRGHQATIGHAVKRARELGVQSVVVTFDPHPAEVVRPGSHPAVLTEPARKAELIEALGVDVLCVVPFTPEFSRLPAEAFVHDVLVEHLHAALVVVGENFRFGHRAAGDVALLERLGPHVRLRAWRGPRWSPTTTPSSPRRTSGPASTPGTWPPRPRRWAARTGWRAWWSGATSAGARARLPHRQPALPPVRGGARRRRLRGLAGPPAGGRAREPRLPAAVSIGTNPTFSGRERRVEAYVAGLRRRPLRRAGGAGLRGAPAGRCAVRRRSSR